MALDLIAPRIFDGNASKGPELFLQGLGQGLQAFARFAEMRRASESDVLRLAAQERMAQQSHEFDKQKLALDADYRDREYDLKQRELQNRQPLLEAQTRAANSLSDYRDRKMVYASEGLASIADIARRKEEIAADFRTRMDEFDLHNPNPTNPVEFYQNVKRLKQEYAYADLPFVKNAFRQLDVRVAEHTLPIKIGDRTKEVPIGQIVENLNDPDQRKVELQKQLLEDSGHIKTVTEEDKRERGWFASWFSPTPVIKKKVPSSSLQSVTEQGEGIDYSDSAPRVPPGWNVRERTRNPMDDYFPRDGSDETLFDDPQSSTRPISPDDLFKPSQIEVILQQAKTAIARGASMGAIAQRLQEEYSIDPSKLWTAANAA